MNETYIDHKLEELDALIDELRKLNVNETEIDNNDIRMICNIMAGARRLCGMTMVLLRKHYNS